MVDQDITTFFNELYDKTYLRVVKYVTIKCSNPDDIADIVQEIYTEAYAVITKKGVNYINNENAFIMHLAKSKVYKHYSLAEKLKNIFSLTINLNNEEDSKNEAHIHELIDFNEPDIVDKIIDQNIIDNVWQQIREKPKDVQKIFFLYYYCGMPLKEISKELKISESNVKHKLYRTLAQIRCLYGKGGEA